MNIEEEIKQKKFRTEYEKVLINLLFTANWLHSQHNRMFKPYQLSSQQYNILRILRGQYPKPTALNLIQERMLDKNSNASRLIDKLKTKDLVQRKECKTDRRQVDILITGKGLELLKTLDPVVEQNEEQLHIISMEEANELSRILDKLRSSER